MNVDERVGQNIRKYRMAYNMTLKELAVLLHKSVSTVSKYEKGDISLDMSTFVELSRILKVSPLAIIGDETAKEIVKAYLDAEFLGGRHETRIHMIQEIENRY